jgi:2-deoxy-D-gluconate 3-dehydrogenase
MTSQFDLTGRVALVTGANTGIGQGIALALAGAGGDVAAAGRSPATETVDKVRALGRKAANFSADLSAVAAVQPLVDAVIAEYGRIDILVNNAGIIRRADAVDFTEEDWDAVMDTNLKTLFFLCQSVGRHMIGRGSGKIINIASMLTFQGGIRVEVGRRRPDQAACQRVGGEGHPGQCDRAGLHRDEQHRGAAGRRNAQPPDHGAYPGGPLGRPR